MIGFLPQPDGLSAPRSYGNPHNQATPRAAGNRMGGNIGISKRPPNFMPQQQQQQIGVQQGATPQQPVQQQQPQPMMQQPPMMPPQFLPQPQFGQRRGQSNLNFGKQYYEPTMPLGPVGY